jgi:hypothetical protein
MYEQIMSSRNNRMFFTLINDIFPENRRNHINKKEDSGIENSQLAGENEWMQEYHIIYNSYILDIKENVQLGD